MLCSLAALALALLGEEETGFDPWVDRARYQLEYRADLSALAHQKGDVRFWIPVPRDTANQKVLSVSVESPWPYRQTVDESGNHIVFVEPASGSEASGALVVRADVERAPAGPVREPVAEPGAFVGPQRRIPLDGQVRELAREVGAGKESDAERIRAFYDAVVSRMRYAKEGQGWGQGDAEWACTSRYGNCTDFHSVLMGMARSHAIPARFVMGFPIPADQQEGTVAGYHCWAELYDAERGWVPVDASEADKSGRVDEYFGRLPSDRVEFTVGRDLVLEPPQQDEPLNFFIYPYGEVDGVSIAQVPWSLRFRRLPPAAAPAKG